MFDNNARGDHRRPFALDTFQEPIVRANPRQSLVVRSCAGSGKSTVLAARAAELIANGAPPERVIVLTFSVKSKDDLVDKVGRVLPEAASRPRVMTHHAHALKIVRSSGISAKVISASEQRKLMRSVMAVRSGPGEASRESVRTALTVVARAKSSSTLPSAGSFERTILDAYQHSLRAKGWMDYEDSASAALDPLTSVSPRTSPLLCLLTQRSTDRFSPTQWSCSPPPHSPSSTSSMGPCSVRYTTTCCWTRRRTPRMRS